MAKSGHEAILEQLHVAGTRFIFGNPGSSEEGLLDTIQRYPGELEYILALQESAALAMADGYCRSTQQLGVTLLHSGVGLGNAIGLLYQAKRGHSPLLVLVGEAGVKYSRFDAQMAVDLEAMARPVTKSCYRVEHPTSLLRLTRRAIKEAMTPPTGPVLLVIPQDILDAPNDEPIVAPVIPDTRVVPSSKELENACGILLDARNPIIFAGDGISRSGAQCELARFAETIGARVWVTNNSEMNLARSHPLFCGDSGHMFGTVTEDIVANADVIIVIGTYLFPEVFPSLKSPFGPTTKVIHVDLNAYEIGKNHPIDIAFVADPKSTLAALTDMIEALASPTQKLAAVARVTAIREANAENDNVSRAQDSAVFGTSPLHISDFASQLMKALNGRDYILFDDALTYSAELTRWMPPDKPGHYFQNRGGSLGVGIPGAIGIKLAYPDSEVIGFCGDGGAMYTCQALWTAAHHHVAAKFIICNNGSYRLLKKNLKQYRLDMDLPQGSYPWFFDITPPHIDFTKLAASMGVQGIRVQTSNEIRQAIDSLFSAKGPFLIDLMLEDSLS